MIKKLEPGDTIVPKFRASNRFFWGSDRGEPEWQKTLLRGHRGLV